MTIKKEGLPRKKNSSKENTPSKNPISEINKLTSLYEDVFKYCAQGIAIGQPGSNKLLTCNPAFARMQGYSVKEISSMPILKMYCKEDHERVIQSLAEADRTGNACFDAQMIRKDGTAYPVHVEAVSVRDTQGKVSYRIGFQLDISKQITHEKELLNAVAKLEAALASMSDAVFISDSEGRFINFNDSFVTFHRFKTKEECRKTLSEYPDLIQVFFPNGELAQTEQWAVPRALRGESGTNVEFILKRKDTLETWVGSYSFAPIRDIDGSINGSVVVAREITDQKKVESELRKSEERFRSTLEGMLEGCQIISPEWRYVYLNDAAAAQARMTKEELLKMNFLEVWPGIEKTELFRLMKQTMETQVPIFFQNQFMFPDGTSGWYELRIQPVPEGVFILSFDITDNKLADLEKKYKSEDLALINELNNAINRGESIEGLIKTFSDEIQSIISCENVTLYLLSQDSKFLELIGTTLPRNILERIELIIGMPIPKIKIKINKGGFFEELILGKKGKIIIDPADTQKYMEEFINTNYLPIFLHNPIKRLIPQIHKLLNIRSVISVPLFTSGQTIGLLEMSRKSEFTQNDLKRIDNIREQLTAIVLRRRSDYQVQLQIKRIMALNEVEKVINSGLDLRSILEIIINQIINLMGVDAAILLLYKQPNQTLEYLTGRGFRSLEIHKFKNKLGEGIVGSAALGQTTIYIPNLNGTKIQFKRAKIFREEKFTEYLGIPLISKYSLKGMLEIFNRSPVEPDTDWIRFMETLAAQAASAIESSQLFEGLQRTNQELYAAYDATIAGWSHAMDLRDKETEGHTQRVTEITMELAEKMGIGADEMRQIRRGALLHDIGKLGVPDNILLKPGKLTDEEWVLMRQHPTYAFNMLSPIEYLKPALDIPYCHHEKWDGSGYPRGLKGESIPIAARLFAIVDVWDALRSDRPYRAKWPKKKVLEHIKSLSGSHFDPAVVGVFLTITDKLD